MADVPPFSSDDIQKLFDNKHIVVIGDSGMLYCSVFKKLSAANKRVGFSENHQ